MTYFYIVKTMDYLKVGHTKNIEQRMKAYINPEIIFKRRFVHSHIAMHFERFFLLCLKKCNLNHLFGEYFLFENRVNKIINKVSSKWRFYPMNRFPNMKFDSAFEVKE